MFISMFIVTILISPDSKLYQILSSKRKTCSLIVYTSSMLEGVNRCITTTMMIIDNRWMMNIASNLNFYVLKCISMGFSRILREVRERGEVRWERGEREREDYANIGTTELLSVQTQWFQWDCLYIQYSIPIWSH